MGRKQPDVPKTYRDHPSSTRLEIMMAEGRSGLADMTPEEIQRRIEEESKVPTYLIEGKRDKERAAKVAAAVACGDLPAMKPNGKKAPNAGVPVMGKAEVVGEPPKAKAKPRRKAKTERVQPTPIFASAFEDESGYECLTVRSGGCFGDEYHEPIAAKKAEAVEDERPPTVQPAPKERHIITPEPNSKQIDWSEERARCDEAWKKRKAKEDAEKEKQVSRDDLPTCKLMGIICPPSTEEMRVRQMSKSARFWDEMYQKQDGWTAQNEKLFACKRDRYPTKEMAG